MDRECYMKTSEPCGGSIFRKYINTRLYYSIITFCSIYYFDLVFGNCSQDIPNKYNCR